MPVREGRWVPWREVLAQKAAVAAPPAEEPTAEAKPGSRPKRSQKAVEAAITDATGVFITMDDLIAEASINPVGPEDGQEETE